MNLLDAGTPTPQVRPGHDADDGEPHLVDRLLAAPTLTRATVVLDVVMAMAAAGGAAYWAVASGLPKEHVNAIWAFPFFTVLALWSRGLYRRRLRVEFLVELGLLVGALSLATMALLSLLVLLEGYERPGALIVRLWVLGLVTLSAGRFARSVLVRRNRARGNIGTPTLIVGAGVIGSHVARRLQTHPDYGLRPVGFLDADPLASLIHDERTPVLGTPDDLVDVARTTGAQHVIVAFSNESDRQLLRVSRCCHALGIGISVVPRLFDAVNQRVELEHLGGLPLFVLRQTDPRGHSFALKHAFDRLLAFIGVIMLSPILAAIALAVRLGSPGPVLFRQRRVGRDGQEFDVLKFRSMAGVPREMPPFGLPAGSAPGGVEGADRRTRVGTFLRRTSLDELPQLFNVLKGDMSLVGPRPERPEFVNLFRQEIERYGERHRVRAGITGWAQVNGLRGKTSILDRAEWDNYYIENWSMRLDLKILALTALAVFYRAE